MNALAGLKYSNSDEWLMVEGKIATLGVSDYAQDQLSDIVFVEVTVAVGDVLKKQANVATIESVKAAADVNLPISGKVVEINEALPNNPELINSDPFGKAWMIKIEISDPSELDKLMDSKAYIAYCETRGH